MKSSLSLNNFKCWTVTRGYPLAFAVAVIVSLYYKRIASAQCVSIDCPCPACWRRHDDTLTPNLTSTLYIHPQTPHHPEDKRWQWTRKTLSPPLALILHPVHLLLVLSKAFQLRQQTSLLLFSQRLLFISLANSLYRFIISKKNKRIS